MCILYLSRSVLILLCHLYLRLSLSSSPFLLHGLRLRFLALRYSVNRTDRADCPFVIFYICIFLPHWAFSNFLPVFLQDKTSSDTRIKQRLKLQVILHILVVSFLKEYVQEYKNPKSIVKNIRDGVKAVHENPKVERSWIVRNVGYFTSRHDVTSLKAQIFSSTAEITLNFAQYRTFPLPPLPRV